jgi:hypothetical protein
VFSFEGMTTFVSVKYLTLYRFTILFVSICLDANNLCTIIILVKLTLLSV